MPFSSSFVSINPDRICLLDKRIPVSWGMTLGRISVEQNFWLFLDMNGQERQTSYYWRLMEECISHNRKEIPGMYSNEPPRIESRRYTDISHTWGWPSAALSKSFNTQTCYLTVGSTLFPSIYTTRSQGKSLIGIETPGDHLKQPLLYATKNLVRVRRRANADIGACRLLHEKEVNWLEAGVEKTSRRCESRLSLARPRTGVDMIGIHFRLSWCTWKRETVTTPLV